MITEGRVWWGALLGVLWGVGVCGAQVEVVTTLPYLEALVEEVGGERVRVRSLVGPGEDPHEVTPSPSAVRGLAEASLFVENGVSLELWAERVLSGVGRAELSRGGVGHVFAAEGVVTLDRPAEGAEGHVHAGGNPHVWLDPVNLKVAARNVERGLARVDPGGAEAYRERREAFEARLNESMYGAELVRLLGVDVLDRMQQSGRLLDFLRGRNLRGRPLTSYAGGWLRAVLDLGEVRVFSFHDTWRYMTETFEVEVVGTLESEPGVPPSPAHLRALEGIAGREGVRLILKAPYYPASRAEGFAERIGGVVVSLPTQPGELGTPEDLFGYYDALFARLVEAVEGAR